MPRFYRSPTWKHLITRRDSTVVTDLSHLASNRRGHFELGGPSFFEGYVPSHDFRVFFPTDDEFNPASFDQFWAESYYGGFVNFPRLSEGMRLMYSFRRDGEGEGGAPWSIRHAGPILEIEDDADPDRRLSRFVAYDPWAYLYQRPVRLEDLTAVDLENPNNSSYPGEQGVVFPAGTRGDEIVCELLRRTIDQDGETYIDAGVAFGGTAFYGGTLEQTEVFVDPVVFPRGMDVGTAWEQMVDSGSLDIVLTPIFDPFNRPGYCAELNIFKTAGGDPGTFPFIETYPTFNWDRSGRSVIRFNRLTEGRERANRIRAHVGGTGAQDAPWTQNQGSEDGTNDPDASWSSGESAIRYGESWHHETYVRLTRNELVTYQARNELIRRRLGLRSWRITPAPEFAPRPFQDYMPGTWIGFYHSARLREQEWWQPNELNDQTIGPRIFQFDIDLSDDSLESVSALEVVVDMTGASQL